MLFFLVSFSLPHKAYILPLDFITRNPLFTFIISAGLLVLLLHNQKRSNELQKIPGSFLARWTPLWLGYHAWKGQRYKAVHAMHMVFNFYLYELSSLLFVSETWNLCSHCTKPCFYCTSGSPFCDIRSRYPGV